jgi:hypothetical protein
MMISFVKIVMIYHIAALERGELPPAHVHYKHVNVALQVRAKANDGMISFVRR